MSRSEEESRSGRRTRRRLTSAISAAALAIGTVAALATGGTPAGAAVSGAEYDNTGCTSTVLPRNDDGSSAQQVALPFTANYYGTTYGGLYVNNNGNVTFRGPLGTFTPFTIQANTPPIIAPFFADVDTRGDASWQVSYGSTTVDGNPAFCVNWNNVGYFSGHTDKLNSFQLMLISRSDIGAGDFDIVMNYNDIQWETGDSSGGRNGFGGTAAGAGFSAGDGVAGHFTQFPGSITPGAFLNGNPDTGLTTHGNTATAGRYLFPIRNGQAPGTASFTGTVYGPGNTAVGGSPVQACPTAGGPCTVGFTGPGGSYTIVGVAPGNYDLTANSPQNSNLTPATVGPISIGTGQTIDRDITLTGPTPPPTGTTIVGPNNPPSSNGIPVVYWQDDLVLDTLACEGAQLQYQITLGGQVIRSGQMVAGANNHYTATVAAIYPNHGDAAVRIYGTCPAGQNVNTTFNIYIDPSGTVVDTHGNLVSGATVTLQRSDTDGGQFTDVPSGSAIMSPANRTNPQTTGTDGRFGWDVIAGYYRLQVSKAGCHVPNSGDTTLTSPQYTIPPAALGITLTLDCPGSAQPGAQPRVDKSVSGFRNTAGTSLNSAPLTTTGPNELLVATVQADGPANDVQRTMSVSGAGLTWTRSTYLQVQSAGDVEIWSAYATGKVTNGVVTARFAKASNSSITVQAFTGAASTLGAVGVGTSPNGPTASAGVTPQGSNSLIVASGLDWSSATKPVPAAGQSLATFFVDSVAGDYYWTQNVAAPTVAGTPVRVSDRVPAGDRWSLVAAEVRAAPTAVPAS